MTESPNAILSENVHFADNKMFLKMLSYKHSKGKQVTISVSATNSKFCPVATLARYLAHRPLSKFLFCDKNGDPVSYTKYSKMFAQVVLGSGLSPYLKPHSARIGAATHAASMGHSEDAIKRMGRWVSGAVGRYLRLPVISL